MTKRLNEQENIFIHRKIMLKDIFSGKKQWSPSRKFEGDYLKKTSDPIKYQKMKFI